MEHDVSEIIILDDYEDDDEYRNARREHRSARSRFGRSARRPAARPVVVSSGTRASGRSRRPASPLVRTDTGGLSTGKLVEAGAQVLAAIQPLPQAPVATGKLESDVENLVLYQRALAEHAKRDEQLRTVGSLASKLFA
jgi:hypothetical protein